MDTLPWFFGVKTKFFCFVLFCFGFTQHMKGSTWSHYSASAAHWNPLKELMGTPPLRAPQGLCGVAVLSWPPGTSLSPGVVVEEMGGQPSLPLTSPCPNEGRFCCSHRSENVPCRGHLQPQFFQPVQKRKQLPNAHNLQPQPGTVRKPSSPQASHAFV